MLNSAYKKPRSLDLYHNWLALYFNQRLEKCFEVTENVKKLMFEEDCAELRPKVSLLRQSRRKYLKQKKINSLDLRATQNKWKIWDALSLFLISKHVVTLVS